LATYAYIENTTKEAKPTFEAEPDDDTVAFKEAMRKGYLTRDESIYFGSKQFNLEEVAILQEG
jgi:hypothetical protein